MLMQELTLRLTIDEANIVLEALGNLPFVKVHTLIGRIQQQATQQLNAASTPSPVNGAEPILAMDH
jgi:hypothetical protein